MTSFRLEVPMISVKDKSGVEKILIENADVEIVYKKINLHTPAKAYAQSTHACTVADSDMIRADILKIGNHHILSIYGSIYLRFNDASQLNIRQGLILAEFDCSDLSDEFDLSNKSFSQVGSLYARSNNNTNYLTTSINLTGVKTLGSDESKMVFNTTLEGYSESNSRITTTGSYYGQYRIQTTILVD